MPSDPFITKARALLVTWSAVRDHMETERRRDLVEGLDRTAEAQECAILAIDACCKGLKDILPPE